MSDDFVSETRADFENGDGFARSVGEELEKKVQELSAELSMLRQRDRVFNAPPIPWIEERVATLQAVLERRTEKWALLGAI